jgi:hypothetical protein
MVVEEWMKEFTLSLKLETWDEVMERFARVVREATLVVAARFDMKLSVARVSVKYRLVPSAT